MVHLRDQSLKFLLDDGGHVMKHKRPVDLDLKHSRVIYSSVTEESSSPALPATLKVAWLTSVFPSALVRSMQHFFGATLEIIK